MGITSTKIIKLKCDICGKEETIDISDIEKEIDTGYDALFISDTILLPEGSVKYMNGDITHICTNCRIKIYDFIKGNYKIIALNITDTFTNVSSIYSLSSVSDKESVSNDDIKEKIIDYCHNYMEDKLPIDSPDLEYNINNIVNDIRKYGNGNWVIGNLLLEAFYLK